jgi:2,3-dimethylmalate lyase
MIFKIINNSVKDLFSLKTLRQMLNEKKPLVIPGVFDAMGAKISEQVGFKAMFQTGYGTSATLFGMPDYGFIGAAETVDNAKRICSTVSVPVIVDADTGYGNALSVWKLVKELEAVGASGIFLEDQRWPKRCGHMKGKEVVSQEEYAEKLGAAIDARSSKNFIIVARTDARATEGLDAAIERGLYNKKIGADAIFVEAPKSIAEMKKIGKSINAPLVANMIEGGATPISSAKNLYKMGFKIILYPLSVLFANTFATMSILKELKKTGTTTKFRNKLVSFDQFNHLVELQKFRELEKKYELSKKE